MTTDFSSDLAKKKAADQPGSRLFPLWHTTGGLFLPYYPLVNDFAIGTEHE